MNWVVEASTDDDGLWGVNICNGWAFLSWRWDGPPLISIELQTSAASDDVNVTFTPGTHTITLTFDGVDAFDIFFDGVHQKHLVDATVPTDDELSFDNFPSSGVVVSKTLSLVFQPAP